MKFCLYLDVSHLFRSLKKNKKRTLYTGKSLLNMFKGCRVIDQAGNDNSPVKPSLSAFNVSDDTLQQWRGRFTEEVSEMLSRANEMQNGKVRLFDTIYDIKKFGWDCNPITLRKYPNLPSWIMPVWFRDYRGYDRFGDERYAMELQKHFGFVELALAYRLTTQTEYLHALNSYVETWSKAVPTDRGIGWYGNIHVAQRMIAWIMTLLVIDIPDLTAATLRKEIIRGLAIHARVLRTRFMYPGNNIKIGSLCSLIIYELTQSRINNKKALHNYLRELRLEVVRQISTSGAPQEGSLGYGILVNELLLLLKLFADHAQVELPAVVIERTRAMTEWYSQILGPEPTFPPIGDESGERGFPFCGVIFNQVDSLAVGQRLFNLQPTVAITPIAWLLLEISGAGAPENPTTILNRDSQFVDTNTGFGRSSVIRKGHRWTVWMRAGRFGLLPKFGHAHSDFLAPIVFLDGNPVLTECGTFQYNTYTEERLKDVLTEGHSGIRYDIFEQSSWGNTFQWNGQPLSAGLDTHQDGLQGWMSMPDKAVLTRRAQFRDERLVITDSLVKETSSESLIEFSFIVDGVLWEEKVIEEGIFLFRLESSPNKLLHLLPDEIMADCFEIRSARIATSYGVAHNGCQIIFRLLQKGSGTWSTEFFCTSF